MGASVWSGVVCEFDNGEQSGPVVLLEISTYMQVLFYFLVNSFQFTIRLWVKGGGQFLFNSQFLLEFLSYLCSEL